MNAVAKIKLPRSMRGSTLQCPKCGSRRVGVDMGLEFKGYGPGLATCLNCKTLWEPFLPEQIWDPTDPHCSFKEACNNCAFRPGSEEQKDRAKWIEMIRSLKRGAGFYCHKGVPITATAEHGFDYPKSGPDQYDTPKLRLCRGYLSTLKRFRAEGVVDLVEQEPESPA